MFRFWYVPILIYHLIRFAMKNQSLGLVVIIILMMCFSLIIVAAQVSAPFIYTLF